MKVELFLDIPVSLIRKLAKTRLRSREVRVDGAGWPSMLVYCEKCGKRTGDFG